MRTYVLDLNVSEAGALIGQFRRCLRSDWLSVKRQTGPPYFVWTFEPLRCRRDS